MSFPKHAEYRKTDQSWFKEIPSHWEIAQIKWLSPVKRGASPRPIDDPIYFDDDGDYGWVRISDVTSSKGVLLETEQKLSDLGSSLSIKLSPGDLFLSIAGSVGKSCFSGIKCCIHDGFVYFPDLSINPRFLQWIFESGRCFGGLGKLGTQLNLNTDTVGSIFIPFSTCASEIEEINSFLDRETAKIDALITEQERLIELLQEKRQAVISHAVTKGLNPNSPMKDSGVEWLGEVPEHWTVCNFRRFINIAEGQVDPREDPYRSMMLIAPNHIESRTGNLKSTETAEEQGAESGKYVCQKGDIIYSKIRPALRKACIAPEKCLTSADMYPLKTTDRLTPEFTLYYLLSEQFSSLAVLESERVAMPKINRDTLGSVPIAIPPISEQEKISQFIYNELGKMDALSNKAFSCIGLMRERKSTLISAAVTGQIDVRGLIQEEEAA